MPKECLEAKLSPPSSRLPEYLIVVAPLSKQAAPEVVSVVTEHGRWKLVSCNFGLVAPQFFFSPSHQAVWDLFVSTW